MEPHRVLPFLDPTEVGQKHCQLSVVVVHVAWPHWMELVALESRVLGTRGSPTLAVACGCVSAAAVSAAAGTTAAAAVGVAAADGGEVGV